MSNENDIYKNTMPTSSDTDINDAYEIVTKGMSKADRIAERRDPSSYLAMLSKMMDMHTVQADFIKETLAFLNKASAGDAYANTEDEENPINLNNKLINMDRSKLKGQEIEGKQAQYMILAKGNNLKRINLYNSGFWIVLRTPSLVEINLVYNQLATDLEEYGKVYGAVFYMYSDYYIKSITWDFIWSLVLDSNLKGWKKGDRLKKGVSLQDYNPILLAIGSLTFADGYPMIDLCTNAKCKTKTELSVDLTQLQLTDFSKVPEEHFYLWNKAKEITLDDALRYQQKVAKVYDKQETIAGYKVTKKIPTMYDYLTQGDIFNEQLQMSIQDIKDEDLVNQYFLYNFSKIYIPWIRSISSMEDGEIAFVVTDPEVLPSALDDIQASPEMDMFRQTMNRFISE